MALTNAFGSVSWRRWPPSLLMEKSWQIPAGFSPGDSVLVEDRLTGTVGFQLVQRWRRPCRSRSRRGLPSSSRLARWPPEPDRRVVLIVALDLEEERGLDAVALAPELVTAQEDEGACQRPELGTEVSVSALREAPRSARRVRGLGRRLAGGRRPACERPGKAETAACLQAPCGGSRAGSATSASSGAAASAAAPRAFGFRTGRTTSMRSGRASRRVPASLTPRGESQ
jgi:hypothetical protein